MPSKTPSSMHAMRIAREKYRQQREAHRAKLNRRRGAEVAESHQNSEQRGDSSG